jgi:lysophospholipase L1-like esterase
MVENKISRKKVAFFLIILLLLVVLLKLCLTNLPDEKIKINSYRVACIGNSITEITNYPNELQNLLGESYDVENFGVSGSTVLKDSFRPYIKQDAFQKAKAFLPNIVIIMLGTNDANTINIPIIDSFSDDYIEIIEQIQLIETKPKILMIKPPPIFYQGSDINNTNLLNFVMPQIEKVANQKKLPLIDVYGELINNPEYFPDGVHPNNKGGLAIATKIYQAITKD